MSDLQRKVIASGLPPRPAIGVGISGRANPMQRKKKDYTPVCWDKYFTERKDVPVGDNVFRVYTRGEDGPVLLFLHGGGFSGLTWALLSVDICQLVKCRCLAVDLRGHGDTNTTDDNDLSADTLASDVGSIVTSLYGDDAPPIVLIGHSMGGAIAVQTAHQQLLPSLIGLAVIDVVEGTALEALTSMQSFLKSRPSSFNSMEQAIEWSLRSNQIRNIESAKVSMAGQLKKIVNDGGPVGSTDQMADVASRLTPSTETITEESEEADTQDFITPQTSADSSTSSYTWRIDLSQTDRFWEGWFSGLSNRFLSCDVPKMLLLAGVDRLDKVLTIGQMQGQFQMQVLPQCGHAVHEDVPDKVAQVIATFLHRHKFAQVSEDFQPTFPAC